MRYISDVNLSSYRGRFLGDKSYAFDDVYFMAKFISKNTYSTNEFRKLDLKDDITDYTCDIFQLNPNSSVVPNYMNEAINVLIFANVLESISHGVYKVKNTDILNYIVERIENAYIFLYILVYKVFENHNLLGFYSDFLKAKDNQKATRIIGDIYDKFVNVSISVGSRKGNDTNWAKMLVKYPLTVLNYANEAKFITRALNITERNVNIFDISINVQGTRTSIHRPKKNEYLTKFNKNYIIENLSKYLFKDIALERVKEGDNDNIAEALADLKIDIIQSKTSFSRDNINTFDQQQYMNSQIRVRNSGIQKKFKTDLLLNNPHKCVLCDFEFTELLTASHIVPYSQCEDTYDAINHYNGLLLCPIHDWLFESGRYVTIKYDTGEVLMADSIVSAKDFFDLKEKRVDRRLLLNERKHYLKMHNEMFNTKNKSK